MGLLTDPNTQHSRVPLLITQHHRKVCVLMYIGGIVWFALLAYKPYNSGTYFSENALLPGLVKSEYNLAGAASRYLSELRDEADRYPTGIPYPWLTAKFIQLGLDTYTHNFTLHYPLGIGTKFRGKSVYAILRAPRAASTEAVVFSVPYRPPTSIHQGSYPAIALMLSLAKFFRRQNYWAKDVIFLVTEHEQLGIQAWLEAYHQRTCGSGILDAGKLEGHSGAIQAAVSLELSSEVITHLDVKVEGLNGQLPNLDLVNLAHRLCEREGLRHTFKGQEDPIDPLSFDGWLHSLTTLLSMVATQATGVPNGNHGLFHRFGIESITLEGVNERMTMRYTADFSQLGRILEGTFRSLNNLLEHFHQSFFFYLLPATKRYISIGMYMPPFGLLAGGLLVKALALWFITSDKAEKQENIKDQNSEGSASNESSCDYSLSGLIPLFVLSHLAGVILIILPQPVTYLGARIGISSEESIYVGLLAFAISVLMLPYWSSRYKANVGRSWEAMKCVSLLEMAALLFSTAMYNFSLALLVSLVTVPVYLTMGASNRRWKRAIYSSMLMVIHPLGIVLISTLIYTAISFPELHFMDILDRGWMAHRSGLMYGIMDSYIYGNWLFDVACLVMFPNWLLLWSIVHWNV